MPAQPAVAVRGATRRFGDVVAFQDLALDVAPEETVCIVGPSGCGKTTLLRCIDGLVHLSAGSISVYGEPVAGPRPDIAMVFQHFGLMPWKTVLDNVAYGLAVRGVGLRERREAARRYLEMVGLLEFGGKYPYQLSGGMQQRVGLARALAVRPRLLLMDEPFASVDALTREVLQQQLLEILGGERTTMIFITHSIDEAIVLGHRVVVLTRRPAAIKADIAVDIPWPRDVQRVRELARYAELRAEVWDLLRAEGLDAGGSA
jgi:NitT/TauT family transport system ATP-binding protein